VKKQRDLERKRAYDAARYAANRERRREQKRRWERDNPEKVKAARDRWRLANLERSRATALRYYHAHPEEKKAIYRKWKYGLPPEQHQAMLAAQGNACAICRKVIELHVDHDHATSIVRGLLCRGCNGGLAGFRDNVEALAKAIEYLTAHRRRDVA
jgi:hypothetical protein